MKKLGTFREYLAEEKQLEQLVESAGNLKGLPKNIVKRIVNSADSGLGGENSEFKLFKTNAKQSDLTSAVKLVNGFVKPEDRGSRSYSRAELEAKANKDAHAGVLVKINGEWAFYAAMTYNNKYNLISDKGYSKKDSYYTSRGRKFPTETEELTATDLGSFIDFKEDTVDIFLVTADVERELKRQERREVRDSINDVKKITPERKKAIIEFLKKRSGGIIEELTSDIKKSTDKLNSYIESSINRAVNGNETEVALGNFQEVMVELDKKLKRINSLGYHIVSMVKEGKIKDNHWSRGSEDSYDYKTFKSLVDAYEKEMK